MPGRIETTVLIVGAGPVGMTLALDLASRGVDVTIAELRRAGEPPSVKCNQISARSMEIFRRLGIAGKLREAGLPADYPNDVVSATTVTGIELARVPIPSRAERYTEKNGPDACWPTPEPTHRVNQKYFEPVLFACAASNRRIRLLNCTGVEDFVQDEQGVNVVAHNLNTGAKLSIACSYLVGCDGAKSGIRKKIGAKFIGAPEVQRVQSTCIRAPELVNMLPRKRAWMYFSLNPRRCGTTIAIDGRQTWQIHNTLYDGEIEFASVDRDWAIRMILGVGSEFCYEMVSKEDWIGRRLVADRFCDRRVFICGDAAHLWIPHAGYGMNAGIADAENLSWKLAAVLDGWAPPAILDAYEAERQPVADQVSRFTEDSASRARTQHREIPAEVEWPGPIGEATRARIGKEAYDLAIQRQCAGGLNFGYFYEGSPIIAYDGEPHPAYTMCDFTSSTVPGCRAPHLWLSDGRSLYDALGPGYTLIRLDPAVRVSGIIEAATQRGVPLSVLDVNEPYAQAVYARNLVLARPDRHVAWRGDEQPAAPNELIDLLSGRRTTRARAK
jgi:2-polyprenyl-6-methoxyphenol hydroxylase-like FAD-dependent oxidoreductase